MDEATAASQGAAYRAALDHLGDDQWAYAVREAILHPDGWFPSPGELESLARQAPPPPTRAALAAARCGRCDGTGFALEERDHPWAKGLTVQVAVRCECRPRPATEGR